MLATQGTLNTYCMQLPGLFRQWFHVIFNSHYFCLNLAFSIANISQKWMLLLQAVVKVHKTVMKGNNKQILL